MLRPWFFIGFTGHREIRNPGLLAGKIRDAIARIHSHTGGPVAAVSSAAKGADALFIEAALDRPDPLPWQLLLPGAPVSFFNLNDFSQREIDLIRPRVGQAFSVHIEPQADPDSDGGLAFSECTTRTVDECDYLIAVWDGQPGQSGGTGSAVAYARELKKPLIWIHSATGDTREENFPAPSSDAAVSVPRADDGLPELAATLRHFDEQALDHGPKSQTIVRDVIWLHLIATIAGLADPCFKLLAGASAVPKITKLSLLLFSMWRGRAHHHLKHDWLRARIVAELCRAAVATWRLPYSDRTHHPVPVPGFRAWQRSLALWKRICPPPPLPIREAAASYVRSRLDDSDHGQIPYFQKQLRGALRKQRIWQTTAHFSTIGAVICAIIGLGLLGLSLAAPESHLLHAVKPAKSTLTFLGLTLPLVAGAAFTYLMATDCNRRVERSRAMLQHLEAVRDPILRATTPGELERRVSETEALLLLEVLEWHSVTHFTSSAH